MPKGGLIEPRIFVFISLILSEFSKDRIVFCILNRILTTFVFLLYFKQDNHNVCISSVQMQKIDIICFYFQDNKGKLAKFTENMDLAVLCILYILQQISY